MNQGPAMVEQRGLVVHIAEGYYDGTISWQKNPDADVSSHFVLAGPHDVSRGTPDGKLAQCVEVQTAAWTQRAGNGSWVSVECSGFTPNKLSAAQCESIAQLLARGHAELGWPLQLAGNPNGKGLGFHSMGTPSNGWTGPTWGHEDCPGPNIIAQLPSIVERAKEIVGGDDLDTKQNARLITMNEIIGGLARGLDELEPGRVIGDDGTPSTKPFDLKPYWARIAAEVAKNSSAGGLVPHTHAGGETGPAVPTTA